MPDPDSASETATQEDTRLHASLDRRLRDRPIVCFANDWGGDPTSKHHVMRVFADHTNVLWVESSGMRMPNFLHPEDLKRIVSKVVRSGKGAVAETGRLHVIAPLTIPLPGSDLTQRLNGVLMRKAVNRARGADAEPPILWIYTPTVAPWIDGLANQGVVYHCVDRWWEFSEFDSELMRGHHQRLCRMADVTFASSQALLDDCAPYTDRAHLLRHGVDWTHFAEAAFKPPPPPADLAGMEGPIIGFFGLIHDWIDQELLVEVARALPRAHLVVIGKSRVDVSALAGEPNITLLGQKPYDELPAYAARFDVALVPFVVNELTRAVNPIKLREYLSAGIPVVSTALPELVGLEAGSTVRVARDVEGFVAAVADVVADPPTAGQRRSLARSMASESWTGRCDTMLRLWEEGSGEAKDD